MTRTFIALETNQDLQRHLSGVIRQVARVFPAVRWVDPVTIHLTLAFLGELSDAQLIEAEQAATQAVQEVRPFQYRLTHFGIFGSPRSPRVIWMGIEEPAGALTALHRALQKELLSRGFQIDTRPFSPHLTLARVKHPLSTHEQQQLQRILSKEQANTFASSFYTAYALDVMKSELSSTGARYTLLRKYVFPDGIGSTGMRVNLTEF